MTAKRRRNVSPENPISPTINVPTHALLPTERQVRDATWSYVDSLMQSYEDAVAAHTLLALWGQTTESQHADGVAMVLRALAEIVWQHDAAGLAKLVAALPKSSDPERHVGPSANGIERELRLRDEAADYLLSAPDARTEGVPITHLFALLYPEDVMGDDRPKDLSDHVKSQWDGTCGQKARKIMERETPASIGMAKEAAEVLIRGFLRHQSFDPDRSRNFLAAERVKAFRRRAKAKKSKPST